LRRLQKRRTLLKEHFQRSTAMSLKPRLETTCRTAEALLEIDRNLDIGFGSTLGKLLWLVENALTTLRAIDPMPWYQAAEPLACGNQTRYARYGAAVREADAIRARLYATTPRQGIGALPASHAVSHTGTRCSALRLVGDGHTTFDLLARRHRQPSRNARLA
jgi:hypothetical protein